MTTPDPAAPEKAPGAARPPLVELIGVVLIVLGFAGFVALAYSLSPAAALALVSAAAIAGGAALCFERA